MKTILPFTAGLCLCMTLISSCKDQSSADNSSIEFSNISFQQNYRLEGSASTFATDSDVVFCDSVNIMMPSMIYNHDISILTDSIMRLAFDTTGVDHLAIINDYSKETAATFGFPVKELNIRYTSLTQPNSYRLITGTVVYMTPEWLSYCVAMDSYQAGAAHGMTTKYYINYLPKENKIVTLNDIFSPEGLKELPEVISKEANSIVEIIGPTDIDSLPSYDNFFISAAGELVFVYQPYDVASYAQGFIQISFYPYELSDYMSDYGLTLFNLQDLKSE